MGLFSYQLYIKNDSIKVMTQILIYFSLSLVHIYGILDLATVTMVYLEFTPLNMTLQENKIVRVSQQSNDIDLISEIPAEKKRCLPVLP